MALPTVYTLTSVVSYYMGEPYASLLNGMVLGIDLPKSLTIYEYFKKTGLLHLVVLSGSNINFLVVATSRLCQRFGTKAAALASLLVITVFILFVGPQPPVVRAGLMSTCTLLALVFNRQSIALVSLLMTAVIIGIVKFEWLATISFQLSFGASLGIILWSSHVSVPASAPTSLLAKILGAFRADIHTTLAAQAVTTPLIFFYFKEVSLIAPLANAAVGFVTGPIMILGIATLLLGKISFLLGYIPGQLAHLCLIYICAVTKTLSSLPYVFVRF